MAVVNKAALEALVRQVLLEKLGEAPAGKPAVRTGGVRAVPAPQIEVTEADRLDTGDVLLLLILLFLFLEGDDTELLITLGLLLLLGLE